MLLRIVALKAFVSRSSWNTISLHISLTHFFDAIQDAVCNLAIGEESVEICTRSKLRRKLYAN